MNKDPNAPPIKIELKVLYKRLMICDKTISAALIIIEIKKRPAISIYAEFIENLTK